MSTIDIVGSPAPLAAPDTGVAPVAPVPDVADPALANPQVALDPAAEPVGTEQPRHDNGRFAKRSEQLNSQISTLTAQKHALHRGIENLGRRAEQMRAPLPAPDPNDYDAQQRHQIRTTMREERLAETAGTVEDLHRQAHEIRRVTFETKIQAAAESVPELRQSLQAFIKLPISEVAAELIAESDQAPALVHYLARNPDEAFRINALPPYRQAAELTRLENRVAAAPQKRVSQAPAPLQTVSGGSGAAGTDLGSMSMPDYYATRMKQMGG